MDCPLLHPVITIASDLLGVYWIYVKMAEDWLQNSQAADKCLAKKDVEDIVQLQYCLHVSQSNEVAV